MLINLISDMLFKLKMQYFDNKKNARTHGNSEIGAISINLSDICLDLEESQIGSAFSPQRPIFLHACSACSELPSN